MGYSALVPGLWICYNKVIHIDQMPGLFTTYISFPAHFFPEPLSFLEKAAHDLLYHQFLN